MDEFSLASVPTAPNVIITGDLNAHHSDWEPSCGEPDTTGIQIHDWRTAIDWEVLNSGAATRVSYSTGSLSTPEVSLAYRDLARRCAWDVGADLGSDHLPQILTATVAGCGRRSLRPVDAALGAGTDATSPDEAARRLTGVITEASTRHIQRGARPDLMPWALAAGPRTAAGGGTPPEGEDELPAEPHSRKPLTLE